MKIQSLVLLASFGLVLSACPPSEEGSDAALVDAGAAVSDAAAAADSAPSSADAADEQDATQIASCDNDDSYEANNSAEEAKAIAVPGTIDNLVGCDEYDWYKFSVPANNGLTVDIDFTAEDADLDLALYEASDSSNSLDSSISSTSDNEQVSAELFVEATDVLVRVKNYDYPDGQSDYTMTVAFYDGGYCENDGYEPNDSAAAAATDTPRHLYARLCSGDVDYYSFTMPGSGEGASVTVDRGDNPLDILLTLEGSTDSIGTLSHDADAKFDRISFSSEVGQTYVLKVSSSASILENYEVEIKGPPPANDVCGDAPVLSPGTSVNGTTTDAENDYQFLGADPCGGYEMHGVDVAYQVAIPVNKYLNLSLDSERDLSMYLLEDCTSRCCWGGVDDHTGGRQENLSYHNISGAEQNLFLIVDSFSSYASGDFVLQAELADAPPAEDGGMSADSGPEPSDCHPDVVPDAGVAEDAS